VEELDAENNPENPAMGSRKLPFSKVLYIEQDDFMEEPTKKYFRLSPGQEVRLKHAYIIKCEQVVKDAAGQIVELHCTYDPETRSGGTASGRKVKGTLHWVSAAHAVQAEIRLYDQLFVAEDPEAGDNYQANLNPESLVTLTGCLLEPGLTDAPSGNRYQFLRQGYFYADRDSSGKQVYNRIVSLRDTWAKIQKG
jgi:glutaminyl-tRNA synthetase